MSRCSSWCSWVKRCSSARTWSGDAIQRLSASAGVAYRFAGELTISGEALYGSGQGIGVGAPQWGARRTLFVGLGHPFGR